MATAGGKEAVVEPPGIPGFLLECLETVWRLEHEHPPAGLEPLGRRLGVSKVTATERVLALEGRGLLVTDLSGHLRLTGEGRRIALGLIRKHRLLERFLTDLLKLPWERVHEEACRLTPVLSEDIAAALAEETGTPLHRLKPGQGGIILRIEREEPEMLRYLATLGLLPQTKVEVEEIAPFGGPVLIRSGDSRYALGRKVAARIFVREA